MKPVEKTEKKAKWERTSVQNLLRNASTGRYYGRWTITVNGKPKQKWLSLDTDVFGVAKLRLSDESRAVEKQRGSRAAILSGECTVGDLMRSYEERTRDIPDDELKPASKSARMVALQKIRKTWPDVEKLKPAQLRQPDVAEWVTRFKRDGTAYTPPGAKTVIRGNSATSVNRAIDTLRRVMDIAIERGAIHTNPVRATNGEKLKKPTVQSKLVLPSSADVQRLFAAIENNGARGGWGNEAADLCRFLACSGCRIGEVPLVTWACVDWEKKLLRVPGFKTQTSERTIPLFIALETLFKAVSERRKRAAIYSITGKPMLEPTNSIFRLSECQKAIDTACAKLSIARITHHDFRHLFATRCIESGVDIPTVSRWLGHADGGSLAMRTYGHLRQEHSQAQAAKVSFG
ncbi:MAG: site-specific integrase [Opitutus sp.]